MFRNEGDRVSGGGSEECAESLTKDFGIWV